MLPLRLPDEQSLSRHHPRVIRDAQRVRRAEILADPQAWAGEVHARVQRSLDGDGEREPIVPRAVKHPGNVSMYDHLTAIRSRLDTDPEGEAAKEAGRIDSGIASLETQMQRVIVWPQ